MVKIKKEHPKFNVPNFGSKNRKRVKARWRKQRGIDNKKRIKRNFAGAEPTIGYKNPKELNGIRANGKRAIVVHNLTELNNIISEKKEVDITFAKALGKRKKLDFMKIANEHKIKVTNGVSL